MWNKHFLIVLLFTFFQQANVTSPLDKIFLEEDQHLRSYSSNSLIFDSNEDDIININKIDVQLIKNAFKIESFRPGNLIHLVFLDSINFNRELVYFVCQLMQNEVSYFITCIDGVLPSKTNQTAKIHQNAKNYSIDLTSDINEKCHELSVDNQNQIYVNCLSKNNTKIYQINFQQQTTFTYQITQELNQAECLHQIFNINQQQILVMYNCENWKVILFQEKQLLIILNYQLLKALVSESHIEINILSEIFVCQTFLFLVEQQNYYAFELMNGNLFYRESYLGVMKIQRIKFINNCNIQYIIVQNFQNSTNALIFDTYRKEIALNKQLNVEVYATNKLLFLKNESQLIVILCDFLNQTYSFSNQKLHFLNTIRRMNSYKIQFPKLFYQIDQITQSAQFYEYFEYQQIIKPTKKYFYEVKNFNLFATKQLENFICQEIIYFHQNIMQYYELFAENSCQFQEETLFLKNQKGLPNMYDMQINQQSKIIQSINDEEDFYKKIKELKNLNIEKIILFEYQNSESLKNCIGFLRNEQLEIYITNDKKNTYQLEKEHQLYVHQGFIAIVNLNSNQLIVLSSFHDFVIQNQINFDEKILKVYHNMQYLIIQFISRSFSIINLQDLSQVQLDETIHQLGVPKYYFKKSSQILIQYEKFLIVKMNKEWEFIIFENFQIFYVYQFQKGLILKVIHEIIDQISLFFIDENSVLSKEQLFISQIQLIRPLIVNCNNNFMAIASMTNSQKSIQIVQGLHFIKLVKIKLCNNFSFVISGAKLIYFNQDNQLKILDLDYYKISLINTPQQTNHLNKLTETVQIVIQQSNEIVFVSKLIQITIYNNCYKLFKKNNFFYQHQTNKLILSKLYHGPIINITSKNDNQLQLTGPFQNHYSLESCSKNLINLCKIDYKILFKSTKQYFNFVCIYQFPNCWLELSPDDSLSLIKEELIYNQTIQLNIIKIDECYFLHQFQIDHQKRLISEISYQLINEITKEFEIQTLNLKNFLIFKNKQNNPSIPYYLLSFNEEKNYSKYVLQNELLFICPIQNYSNLYLILQWTQKTQFRNKIEFQIVQLINNQTIFLFSFILQDKFLNLVEHHIRSIPFLASTIQQISFCNLNDQKVELNIFFIFDKFSCEIKVIYDQHTKEQQYQILQIFRNPLFDEAKVLNYYDQSYLILSTLSQHKYLYDLTQNQSMYDHISRIKNDMQLTKVNNNLYLFTSKTGLYVGEIGYKISDVGLINQEGKNIHIFASNEVSKDEEIYLVIEEEETNNQENRKLFAYFSLFAIVSLFSIYFIRRKLIQSQTQKKNYNRSCNQE